MADALKGLKGRRRLFVLEYFATGMNGTRAAINAGYAPESAHVESSRLLKNAKVREALEAIFKERTLSKDEVLARLTEQARGDILDVLKDDGTLDFEKAKRLGKTALIKKISQRTVLGENSETHIIEVELHNQQKALEIMGKWHALWTDRVEHSGSADKPPIRFVWDDMNEGDNSGHGDGEND